MCDLLAVLRVAHDKRTDITWLVLLSVRVTGLRSRPCHLFTRTFVNGCCVHKRGKRTERFLCGRGCSCRALPIGSSPEEGYTLWAARAPALNPFSIPSKVRLRCRGAVGRLSF